jgi:methylglutaconyl-CoA hydratase
MIQDFHNGYVTSETHKGITTIEFFHPQSNSLPRRLLSDLASEIHAAGSDEVTKVIVLRAGGEKAFCAGASFGELTAIKNESDGFEFFRGFADIINALRVIPQLVIGRISGKCVGGGVGIAAAVDYAIAVDTAEVRLSELSLGIGPFVVGPAIERKIGLSAYSQLAIDATMWRGADWARRKGLYAELHDTVEGMDESISRLANQLAHTSLKAMAELKRVFWKGTDHWDTLLYQRAEISGRLAVGDATKAAIEKIRTRV